MGRTRTFRAGLLTLLAFALMAGSASADHVPTHLVVNDTGDLGGTTPRQNCVNGNPGCTLRAALEQANADDGSAEQITFDFSDAPSNVINATLPYPSTLGPVTIDGEFLDAPVVDGSAITAGTSPAFTLAAPGATIRGITVQDFPADGIAVTTGGSKTIENNFISNNGDDGVQLAGTANAGPASTTQDNTIVGNGNGDNLGSGVHVTSGSQHRIRRNSFSANTVAPIELELNTNMNQAAPTLSSPATETLRLTLNNEQAGSYSIDIFSDPGCTGTDLNYYDSTTITVGSSENGTDAFVGAGSYRATATDANGNTSVVSFGTSGCATVAPTPPPEPAPQTPPFDLAQALFGDPIITGATYVEVPPGQGGAGPVNVVFNGAFNGFPRSGPTFSALTTGDANLAPKPNDSPASGASAGNSARGANDVTVLKVDVNMPPATSCLQFDFRFLSEEYPEFVGSSFNDAFIAELDNSTWSLSGSEVSAPNNFAFDEQGNVISVNATGTATVAPEQAGGTTYDAATKLLRASVPTTPGPHSLFLSVYDASDSSYDSAAFIDAIAARSLPPEQCRPGVVDANAPTPQPQQQEQELPAPVQGRTANFTPRSGEVFVKLPRGEAAKPQYRWAKELSARSAGSAPKGFIPLSEARQLPIGSILDTRRGTVGLTAAVGTSDTQAADFSQGLFAWRQSTKNPLTTLTMKGALKCKKRGKRGSKKASAARTRSRSIFGSGRGRFRTRGRRSSATVRGTQWLQKDTCAGTLTLVREGTVAVKDVAKRKPIVLKAPGPKKNRRHFARVPKR